MTETLSLQEPDFCDRMLCYYVNTTSHIQIMQINSITNQSFERVVFPGQRLIFEASPEAQLEVHTGTSSNAVFSDHIPCVRLQVQAGDHLPFKSEVLAASLS